VADQPAGTGPAPTQVFSSGHPGPGSGLRRADGLVLGASVLLFVASFLPFYDSGYGTSTNAWTWFLVPLLVVGFGSGVLAGLLVALERFTTVGDVAGKVGLTLHQLSGVLAVVSAAELTLSVISAPLHGLAQWLALVAAALLLIGTVFARHVPALTVPVGASAPRASGAATSAPWAPAPTPAAAGAPAPAPETVPFWFSVSAPVLVHDRADGSVRGELQPGRWYLATTSFGTAVEVSAEEFGTAILHDLSVLQRA